MKKLERKGKMIYTFIFFYLSIFISVGTHAAIIIDHNCTNLSQIPDAWIDAVQENKKLHYAHTSHGSQLTVGLERIEAANSKYSVAIAYCELPDEAGAFCIFDGQTSETYITPDLYWDSASGRADTNSVLSNNPTITTSMWAWCSQQNWNTSEYTQSYLDAMALLESDNPEVTFVYMTGNAQTTGSDGYNRYLRNNQIRDYCLAHDKVLFDFADLDCWYNGEQATYQYGGHTVPVEHPQYNGNEAGHTTYESCEQKGRAVWWMMARLAEWDPGITTTTTVSPTITTVEEPPCPIEEIYGEYSEATELLRYFRDNLLSETTEGQELIRLYYKWSPIIVKAMEEDEEFKEGVKEVIDGILPPIRAEVE